MRAEFAGGGGVRWERGKEKKKSNKHLRKVLFGRHHKVKNIVSHQRTLTEKVCSFYNFS